MLGDDFREEGELIVKGSEIAKKAFIISQKIQGKENEVAYALITRDAKKLGQLSKELEEAAVLAKNVMLKLGIELMDLPPEQIGEIHGQVLYQAVLAVLTAGVGNGVLKAGTGAKLLARLEETLPVLKKPGVRKAFLEFFKLLETQGVKAGSLERQGIKLRRVLEDAGKLPEGYAAHHLIPVSVAEDFPILQLVNYDINSLANGIALPTTAEEAAKSGLQIHSGGHLDSYFDEVRRRLTELTTRFEEAADAGKPWDGFKLEREIHKVEDGLRADIESGELKLQNK
jgi:hypothetical protein